ncbi:MAG: HAD-IIIA family hydrolase [Desulfobacteraceae bacterium]|nr:HAD-IIIA family hydrolase [Desulfobacteraceae bacterium]
MIDNKLEKIRLVLLDADGVLTRGKIIYTEDGNELKAFDVKDGFGIRMLQNAGIKIGIITGRYSETIKRRARELKIDFCHCGVKEKKAVFYEILQQTGFSRDQTVFVGDDIPDIAVMKNAGVGIAVADAHESVKQHADLTTRNPGGRGAVREVCECILKAKGLWEEILQSWVQTDFPDSRE